MLFHFNNNIIISLAHVGKEKLVIIADLSESPLFVTSTMIRGRVQS